MDNEKLGILRNKYTIEIIDKNGNLVNSKTFYNLAYNVKYTDLHQGLCLHLGTMLENDYKKFQRNGKWLEGYATHFENGASEPPKGEVEVNKKDKNGKPYYVFQGKITENDTSLWGTIAWVSPQLKLNYKNNIPSNGANSFSLTAETEWGYHRLDNKLNLDNKVGNAREVVQTTSYNHNPGLPGTREVTDSNGNTHWERDIPYIVEDQIYGIEIWDGALCTTYGLYTQMVSHFAATGTDGRLIKRPSDILKIKIDITFGEINTYNIPPLIPFHPIGNILYGNKVNSISNGTPDLNPLIHTPLVFSGQPFGNDEASNDTIAPRVPVNGIEFSLSTLVSDIPELAVMSDEQKRKLSSADLAKREELEKRYEDIPKDNFPRYYYFGNFKESPYVILEDENGKKSVKKDDFGRRVIKNSLASELIPKKASSRGYSGPIKSVILPNYGACSIEKFFDNKADFRHRQSGIILSKPTYFNIGNTHIFRFYHPFFKTTDKINEGKILGLTVQEEENFSCDVDNITYCDNSDSLHNNFGTFIGISDGNKMLWSGNRFTNLNEESIIPYDKENHKASYALNPFDMKYYPSSQSGNYRNLLGSKYEWLIYRTNGIIPSTIMKGAIANTALGYGGFAIAASDSAGKVGETIFSLPWGGSLYAEMDETAKNTLANCNYIAVQADLAPLAVGSGMWISCYDTPAIRFGDKPENIKGYVDVKYTGQSSFNTNNINTIINKMALDITVTFNRPYAINGANLETCFYFKWERGQDEK